MASAGRVFRDELLVTGYIRQHNKSLYDKALFPSPIEMLCLDFYEFIDLVFYVSPQGLFAANCNHNHSKYSNWLCKIIDINTKTDIHPNIIGTDYYGLNYAQNISLSQKIVKKMYSSFNLKVNPTDNTSWNILFKCGAKYYYIYNRMLAAGDTAKCSAIIFDKSQFAHNTDPDSNIITLYHWTLSLFYEQL